MQKTKAHNSQGLIMGNLCKGQTRSKHMPNKDAFLGWTLTTWAGFLHTLEHWKPMTMVATRRAALLLLLGPSYTWAHGKLTCPAPRQYRDAPIAGASWTSWQGIAVRASPPQLTRPPCRQLIEPHAQWRRARLADSWRRQLRARRVECKQSERWHRWWSGQ